MLSDKTGARIVGTWDSGCLVEELVEAIVPPLEVDSVAGPGAEQRVFVATRDADAPTRTLADEVDSGSSLLLFTNGDKYVGGLQGGKKSGNGLYIYADGSAHKGTWVDDALDGVAHPVVRSEESTELANIHDMNERNASGVASLKTTTPSSRQAVTLTRLQD